MKKNLNAFSLIELSIVILIIGILIAGITQSSRLVKQFKLRTAQTLTNSSPVPGTKDLVLWLETTQEASLGTTLNDGDAITNWNDINPQSSSKVTYTQATTANKPSYLESGIGGIPSVKFDGITTPRALMSTGPEILASSNYTIFVVFNSDADTVTVSSQDIVNFEYDSNASLTDNSGLHGISVTITNTSTTPNLRTTHRAPVGNVGGDSNISTSLVSYKKDYIVSLVRNFTATTPYLTAWLNNTAYLGTGSTVPSPAVTQGSFDQKLNNSSIGVVNDTVTPVTARPFNGQISEIIVFSRALKQSEIDDIEAYLSKKYGIKLS